MISSSAASNTALEMLYQSQSKMEVDGESTSSGPFDLDCVAASSSTKLLRHNGPQPSAKNLERLNALHLAAREGSLEKVQHLISSVVDIDEKTTGGQTALNLAAETGNFAIVHYLLTRGANINVQDLKGWTILHLAVLADRTEDVRSFLIRGVDVTLGTETGETALHLAAKNGNFIVCQMLLVSNSELVHFQDNRGYTPLHYVANSPETVQGRCQLVEFFIVSGAKVQVSGKDGETPLSLAVKNKNLSVVKALLKVGANIRKIFENGQTILHIAAEANCLGITKILESVEPGSVLALSALQTTDNEWTPLHVAVSLNHRDFVKELLELKVDTNVLDGKDQTALQLAEKDKLAQIVKLLKPDHAKFWKRIKEQRTKKELTFAHLEGKLLLQLALHRYFTFPADYDDRAEMRREDLANNGFYFVHDYKSLQCFFCTFEITSLHGWKNLNSEEMKQRHMAESKAQFGECCPLYEDKNCKNIPINDPTMYNFESHRLYSLLSDFFGNTNVSVYALANNGFYYTGQDDNCRCQFCKLEVRGWEPQDTAEGEHRRWNPRCIFLQNKGDISDNIGIGHELKETRTDRMNPFVKPDFSKYGRNISLDSAAFLTVENLGLTLVGEPKYRQFCTIQSRAKSFADWPKQLTQKPHDLIEAGFFYTGSGDRVLCFQCGGGLKDWDPKDTPWQEHSKWFASCAFLKLKKGGNFATPNYINSMEASSVTTDSASASSSGNIICSGCSEIEVNCVNLPCGHMTHCFNCAKGRAKCTHCNLERTAVLEVFL